MSRILDTALDAERLAECQRHDEAMRTVTHAHLLETTRRYPRTTGEAWPRTAEYAAAIRRPQPTLWQRLRTAVWRWL